MKRLSFTCLLNLSSWRFFGGSIDLLKYSGNIQWDFVWFFQKNSNFKCHMGSFWLEYIVSVAEDQPAGHNPWKCTEKLHFQTRLLWLHSGT